MKAILLTGGKGTRLRPLTIHTPKPLVPIFNRPFLLYQIDLVKLVPEIDEVILSLNYQPRRIEEMFGDGSGLGIKIRYVVEKVPLESSIDAIAEGDRCVVFNGPILIDVDLPAAAMNRHEAAIVLGTESAASGVAIVTRRVLERVRTEVIRSGESVKDEWMTASVDDPATYRSRYSATLRTPDDYLRIHRDLLERGGLGSWDASTAVAESASRIDAAGAVVEGPVVVAESATIAAGCRIKRYSVVGEHCHIDAGAAISGAVVWPHTRIGAEAEIGACVIGRQCHIGKKVSIRTGAVLGDKAVLPDYTRC
ncbi:MAG: sugar phosphate nucleotidyltransferase [Vicinamibacterales bacterium]